MTAEQAEAVRHGYRMDRRAQAARGAFYGSEHLRALDAEVARRLGGRGMTLAEAMQAVDALDDFTFRRLTQGVPAAWWDGTEATAEPAPVAQEAPQEAAPAVEAIDYPDDRAGTIARIKAALRKRSGRAWSVTGGRGTAYGWIEIRATKRYSRDGSGFTLTDEDRDLLGSLLGLGGPVHFQGVSIPAGPDYRREYIDRAEGREPSVTGKPYWD